MKAKHTAIIIGAGNIASFFDSPRSTAVFTHAHAYQRNPKTTLLGFFDRDAKISARAAKRWGVRSFQTLSDVRAQRPDIVSICTPDITHATMLLKVLGFHPQLVIAEKPLSLHSRDAEKVIRNYRKTRIPVVVNYSYLYDATLQKVCRDVRRGHYGKILGAHGSYTKGLMHNGSHLMSIARLFFGTLKSARPLYALTDYTKHDKSIAAFLTFEKCPQFHLMVGDERKFTLFEFEIVCEKARIRLTNVGFALEVQTVSQDKHFTEYRTLGPLQTIPTDHAKLMSNMISNAVAHMDEGRPLICSMQDAYEIQKMCEVLLKNPIS